MSTRPSLAQEIEARRLERMRMGQAASTNVTLPSDPEIKFALVPLTEGEYELGLAYAAGIEAPETMAGYEQRDRARTASDLFHAMRRQDDLSVKAFERVEDVAVLDQRDTNYLAERYIMLTQESSPSLDGLSPEDLDELKKAFETTEWNELDGQQWEAVKVCLSILLPELLTAKLSGSISTESSMTTSGGGESTPIVPTS